MAISMKSMGLIAACLMLLVTSPALAGRPNVGRKTLGLGLLDSVLDPVLGLLGLVPYSNEVLDLNVLNILDVDVDLNGGYILEFVDKKHNDPLTLCSCKSEPSELPAGDISVLEINVNAFKGALLEVDAELLGLVIVEVEVLEINGIKNYLYHCRSADGTLKQLVRAFVNCGRLHAIRAQCHADKWSVLYPLFRKSLLSYVLKAVVCLVKGVLGGLLGR